MEKAFNYKDDRMMELFNTLDTDEDIFIRWDYIDSKFHSYFHIRVFYGEDGVLITTSKDELYKYLKTFY